MNRVRLQPTRCAICGTEGAASELCPATVNIYDFNPGVFSARRLPDRRHYRIVRCDACGLVRSDPVADATIVAELYRQSTFDYDSEVSNLRRTYGRYLDRLADFGVHKGSLLEVGCGNGFFLEEARARGYAEVRGIEPGYDAVAKAAPGIRERIVCDTIRPGLFPSASVDVVCLFQVIDHLSDPAAVLCEAYRLLKPGGFVLILSHNISAVSARVLGEHSPIIDVEHTFLFNTDTLARLVTAQRFTVREAGKVWNIYTLQYVFHLAPVPRAIKQPLLALLTHSRLGRVPVSLPLGNLYLVAQKRR